MGDELKNAVLETLCSRGPWGGGAKGSRWAPAWTLTADEIRVYYGAIRTVAPAPWTTLGLPERDGNGALWGSHPKTGRANTLLKRAGLIRFDRKRRRWVAIEQVGDDPA